MKKPWWERAKQRQADEAAEPKSGSSQSVAPLSSSCKMGTLSSTTLHLSLKCWKWLCRNYMGPKEHQFMSTEESCLGPIILSIGNELYLGNNN